MTRIRVSMIAALVFVLASSLVVAAGKTYQVTGPVLELTNDTIVVQKGKDKWEIARDASTKINGDLKVGSRVTIEYTMTATTIEVKKADQKGAAAHKSKP